VPCERETRRLSGACEASAPARPRTAGGRRATGCCSKRFGFRTTSGHEPATLWLSARRARFAQDYDDPRFDGPFDPLAFDLDTTNLALAAVESVQRP
jgi:hypothetical protein